MLSRNMGHKHYAVWNDTTLTFPEGEWYMVGLPFFLSTSSCCSRFFLNITHIRALTMVKGKTFTIRIFLCLETQLQMYKEEIGLVIDASPSAV